MIQKITRPLFAMAYAAALAVMPGCSDVEIARDNARQIENRSAYDIGFAVATTHHRSLLKQNDSSCLMLHILTAVDDRYDREKASAGCVYLDTSVKTLVSETDWIAEPFKRHNIPEPTEPLIDEHQSCMHGAARATEKFGKALEDAVSDCRSDGGTEMECEFQKAFFENESKRYEKVYGARVESSLRNCKTTVLP